MKRLIKLTSQVNFYFFHDSPVEQTSPVEHSKRGQATAVKIMKSAINNVTAVHPLKEVWKVKTLSHTEKYNKIVSLSCRGYIYLLWLFPVIIEGILKEIT